MGFQFCPTRRDRVFIRHPKTPKILPVNIAAHFWKAPQAGIQEALMWEKRPIVYILDSRLRSAAGRQEAASGE